MAYGNRPLSQKSFWPFKRWPPQNGQAHSNNYLANRQIVWVCWTILWGWHLQGYDSKNVVKFSFNVLILYPLEASGNLWISDVFRSYRKGILVRNRLSKVTKASLSKSVLIVTRYVFKSPIPTKFEFNNRNRKRCEIYSKSTLKTSERPHLRRPGVFIVNLEHILTPFSSVSIIDFERVSVS